MTNKKKKKQSLVGYAYPDWFEWFKHPFLSYTTFRVPPIHKDPNENYNYKKVRITIEEL